MWLPSTDWAFEESRVLMTDVPWVQRTCRTPSAVRATPTSSVLVPSEAKFVTFVQLPGGPATAGAAMRSTKAQSAAEREIQATRTP